MIRTSIRRASTKSIPHEPIPKNKYNQVRSGFNFKPVPTEGLVYNPPAAIIKPYMQTPYLFLPESDPRREFAKQFNIKPEIVKDMPIIKQFKAPHEREYNVTPEILNEIKKLRNEDPERWTLKAISTKYDIAMSKLYFFLRNESVKKDKQEPKPSVVSKRYLDRQKRRQLWITNQY